MADEKETSTQIAAEVVKKPASDWLTEQYLPFAMYAIHSRALISDDGLKPVNRRILYSLFKEGVTPNSEHLKAARAAANAVAYHPHGSSSIEDALARIAQPFSLRVPLIDPYGTVGAVTGDSAAAARYWECRLSKAAMEFLKELPDGAVPIGKNFDGKLDEPVVLPIRWPNNIINGTQGIAVGYASQMYSHNPDETIRACIKILKNPDLTIDELMKIMPGPDLPTGGELFEIDGVKKYYETGSGRFTLRGRYTTEHLSRGRVRFIFYELPYQVSASDVMSKINDLKAKGKFKEISTVKDLTDKKNGLRLAIETKSGTNHLSVLNDLFKNTPIESRYSVNSTVLVDGSPVQLGMLELLQRFVDFRRSCTVNKAATRMSKIDARVHQLDAILAALVDIDECIAIIRNADSSDEAKKQLMNFFKLDSDQADYILSMQLRKLTKADSISLAKENESLLEEKKQMEEIMTSQEKLDVAVEKDLKDTLKVISDKRRTVISGMTSEEMKEASKEKAQEARNSQKNMTCYVVRFVNGKLLKTFEEFSYSSERKLDYGPIAEQLKVKTQDHISLIASDGIGYSIPLSYLVENKALSPSEIGVHFNKGAKLVAIGKCRTLKTEVGLVLATRLGDVKLVSPELPKKESYTVYKLNEGDSIMGGFWVSKTLASSFFISVSSGNNVLAYKASSIHPVGLPAGGVKSQKLKDGEEIVYFGLVPALKKSDLILVSQSNTTLKTTPLSEIVSKGRGSQGALLHKFKKGETGLLKAFAGNNVVVASQAGNNVISLPAQSRRAASGIDFNIPVTIGASSSTNF